MGMVSAALIAWPPCGPEQTDMTWNCRHVGWRGQMPKITEWRGLAGLYSLIIFGRYNGVVTFAA